MAKGIGMKHIENTATTQSGIIVISITERGISPTETVKIIMPDNTVMELSKRDAMQLAAVISAVLEGDDKSTSK